MGRSPELDATGDRMRAAGVEFGTTIDAAPLWLAGYGRLALCSGERITELVITSRT
jgi:hypothetical protein